MNTPIQVILVEDHELTRKGMVYLLSETEDIQVVGVAQDGQEAVEMLESIQPDIILMDIVLPILNGIEATKRIKAKYPEIKVIILTSYGDQEKVFSAFAAGAEGYCMKDIKEELLVQVIRLVRDGAIWLDPAIAGFIMKVLPLISQMMKNLENREKVDIFELTEREKEILILISQGLNNKDISAQLEISPFTVKNHVSSIIQKLSVEDRVQAVVLALHKGII
ncbi:MAG: response regulator transcription factor [Cyanobacteria bacterium]|nr:response regulator transcription factor [Cyanobacteriota bacterium]